MASFFYQLNILCLLYQVICCITILKEDEQFYKDISSELYKPYKDVRVTGYDYDIKFIYPKSPYSIKLKATKIFKPIVEEYTVYPDKDKLNVEIELLYLKFKFIKRILRYRLKQKSTINLYLEGKYTYCIFISLKESLYSIKKLNLDSNEVDKYKSKQLENIKTLLGSFNGRLLYSTKLHPNIYESSRIADTHCFVFPISLSNDEFGYIKSSIKALISSKSNIFII